MRTSCSVWSHEKPSFSSDTLEAVLATCLRACSDMTDEVWNSDEEEEASEANTSGSAEVLGTSGTDALSSNCWNCRGLRPPLRGEWLGSSRESRREEESSGEPLRFRSGDLDPLRPPG